MAERNSSSDSEHHPWISSLDSDNLTGLSELNQQTLLNALKKRYLDNLIYTDVGDILVAINPFCMLPIYDKSWSVGFIRPDLSGLVPHIYKTAARAYNAMVQAKKDQVCVISGESGAGKTESAKLIMKQVMDMCKSSGVGQMLQHKITQLNPILEAFGNAKTALNDNSSRFGKFIQLIFEPSGRIVGAGLEQYLLEKSRVCLQGDEERNFHIFYYMYAGLDQSMLRQVLLKEPNEHRYLKKYSQVMEECTSPHNKELFSTVSESMLDIGFQMEEIQDIYKILAAIILMGDIEFVGADGSDDNAIIENPEAAEQVTTVLQLENSQDLCFALTTLRTETRGEAVDKRYNCKKAADVRDALAKALYARLFQWIVKRLNGYLQPEPFNCHLNIGILDIFGFENFEWNSFEQFCINLANEQLQCYFNHQIFAMEKVELMKEGLENLGEITYTDNKPVLDLFLNKPIGLLSLLDEQCRGLNGTEKAFVQRSKECFNKHSNFTPDKGSSLEFTIKHYAGPVLYKIEGFLEKNKDSLPDTLIESVKYCKIQLVGILFRSPTNPKSSLKKSILRKNQRTVMRAMSIRKSKRVKNMRGKSQRALTVGGHFQESLKELMERIFAASPHFIRCIKPNYQKKPMLCDDEYILKQLTYTGMLEAVRVRREGFAYRPYFSDFFSCYRSVAYYFTDSNIKGSEAACQVILKKAGLDGWQMGKSRVFLKYFHEAKLHLILKDMEDKAILIQKLFRGWRTRKYTGPLRDKQKREKVMAADFLHLMNIHGKECVEVLIALNKTDILLAKKRFGNISGTTSHKPLTSRDSYKALSTEEKKVRKAQQFGVKLIPDFSQNGLSPLKHNYKVDTGVSSDPEDSTNQESEDEVTSDISHIPSDQLTPQCNIQQVSKSQDTIPSPHPIPRPCSPVPHPRCPRRRPVEATDRTAVDITMGQPTLVLHKELSPTPKPRSKVNRIPKSVETSNAEVPSGITSSPKHVVGGVKLLPTDSQISANLRPTPKPRLKQRDESHEENRPVGGGAETIKSNQDTKSSPESNGSSQEDNRWSQAARTPEDRTPEDRTPEDRTPEGGTPEGGTPEGRTPEGRTPEDISNMKLRPLSIGIILERDEVVSRSRIRAWSEGCGNNNSQSYSPGAPIADRRSQQKISWRFSNGFRARTPSISTICPAESEESNLDVLGLYPGFNMEKALEYVLGQPRGTYVIYKENESNQVGLVLMVSEGRSGVKTYPVLSSNIDNQVYLGNVKSSRVIEYSNLKALVEHYRVNELSSGLKLSQPRLLAGIPIRRLKKL